MIPVVTAAEMRAIDAASEVPEATLVERAGAAVARNALAMLGGTYGRRVAVLAGPGNNGADGRVAAARLERRGVSVRIHEARTPPPSVDADLVIDAAFGTGMRGTWSPPDVGAALVLAVDIPSGLDADTGIAAGPVLAADRTVTFAALKPGLLLADGRRLAGDVIVADIGLDVASTGEGASPTLALVEGQDVTSWIPAIAHDAHKWSHAVRAVAGGAGMSGAAWLLSAAAQRMGAGMVVVSSPGVSADALDAALPAEVVARSGDGANWEAAVLSDLDRFGALAVGPGLGRRPEVMAGVRHLVTEAERPIVIDGDGLSAIASDPTICRERPAATVLTPHDGEFRLLAGGSPGADRIGATRRLAERSGAVVLLKGPTTIVAEPDGRGWLVDVGDARLATAGTGDVLTGIIAALAARGVPAGVAAAAGAWMHASASRFGPARGLIASDVVAGIPLARDLVGR